MNFPLKNTPISLTSVEVKLCEGMGLIRYNQNREAGKSISVISDDEPIDLDVEGICGEMSFCKLYNLYFDPNQYVRNCWDNTDNGDCKLMGWRVDVKTTKYNQGRLLSTNWKSANVDVFVLMTGKRPDYVFRGFMLCQDLLQQNRLKKMRGRDVPSYAAEQHELVEFHQLERLLSSVKVESPV